MGAVAFQTVCEELYHHQYYLRKVKTIEKDPDLAQYKDLVNTQETRS